MTCRNARQLELAMPAQPRSALLSPALHREVVRLRKLGFRVYRAAGWGTALVNGRRVPTRQLRRLG